MNTEQYYELYYQAIISKLEVEIAQLKSELSKKDKYITDIQKIMSKVDSLTENETDFSIEHLMSMKEELSNFVKDLYGRNETKV